MLCSAAVLAPNQSPIRLLLADDSQIVRKGICRLLAENARIDLVGEAATFGQLIAMATDVKPQVIVMDLCMPDDAQFTPQQIRSNLNQESRLVAMSLRNDKEAESLAQSYGATLLLDKINLYNSLVSTIVELS